MSPNRAMMRFMAFASVALVQQVQGVALLPVQNVMKTDRTRYEACPESVPKGTCCVPDAHKQVLDTAFEPDEEQLSKIADECLFLGRNGADASEGARFSYPADAEAHFKEIHDALADCCGMTEKGGCGLFSCGHYSAGYRGPWIENHWIEHFRAQYQALPEHDRKFSRVFGPYIPLLLTWVDNWVSGPWKYPEKLKETLQRVLRKDVLYITVSQNDEGVAGKHELNMTHDFSNILVMSAGGYGNVAVPLLKQQMTPPNKIPMSQRTNDISFVGSKGSAPNGMRVKMVESMENSGLRSEYYQGTEWEPVMGRSKASLCPRGFGRTAYHVVEIIQSGLVPVYVYDDVPWVPYPDLFGKLGYVVEASNFSTFLTSFRSVSNEELEEKERMVAEHLQSHFTYCGVMDQISRFMLGRPTDLKCQALPPA